MLRLLSFRLSGFAFHLPPVVVVTGACVVAMVVVDILVVVDCLVVVDIMLVVA